MIIVFILNLPVEACCQQQATAGFLLTELKYNKQSTGFISYLNVSLSP